MAIPTIKADFAFEPPTTGTKIIINKVLKERPKEASDLDGLLRKEGYAISNAYCDIGLVQLVDMDPNTIPPSGVAMLQMCYGTINDKQVFLTVGEICKRNKITDYDPPLTEDELKELPGYQRTHLSIFVNTKLMDRSTFNGVLMNTFGKVLKARFDLTGFGSVMLDLPLQLEKIQIMQQLTTCIVYARSAVIMQNATTMRINSLDSSTFLSIFVGICGLMPDDICDVGKLYTSLISDAQHVIINDDGFFAKHVENMNAQALSYHTPAGAVIPNKYLLLSSLWVLLNGCLRSTNYNLFAASTAKRLSAVSSILTGPGSNPYSFQITSVEHDQIRKCRQALLPHVGAMIEALFKIPANTNDLLFEEVRKYIREMMCGQDMGGFMVIQDFIDQTDKTRAHVSPVILKEAKAYLEMRKNVEKFCKDRGVMTEGYKLIDPKASLIRSSDIRNIRFAAIYCKKKSGVESWKGFANVDNMPGVNTAEMKKLCDTELKLAVKTTIGEEYLDVAKHMGIPVNDKNEVLEKGDITKGNSLAGLIRMLRDEQMD